MKVSRSKEDISQKTRLHRVLNGERLDPPPIWYMRQAGRYLPEYQAVRQEAGDFISLCLTPEKAAEVTVQPVRRFNLDAAIIFADILLIPYAMGQSLEYVEGRGPILEPVRQSGDVKSLKDGKVPDVLAGVFETVRIVRDTLPAETSVIGFAGAPWTVAAYMVEGRGGTGFPHAKRWALSDPAGFENLVSRITDATVDYLCAQIAAGADVIQVFDSWAGLLPWQSFERWAVAPMRRVVEGVRRQYPGIPIIGFPRGIGTAYPVYAKETGITAVSVDEAVSPEAVVTESSAELVFQGNLDPQWVVIGGEAMKAAAGAVLDGFSGRAHIFNLGHGLVPETPPEHVAALTEFVRMERR